MRVNSSPVTMSSRLGRIVIPLAALLGLTIWVVARAALPATLLVWYTTATIFAHYLTLHVRDFQGGWPRARDWIARVAFIGTVFVYGFLIYCAFAVGLWPAVKLGLVAFLIGAAFGVVEVSARSLFFRDLPLVISLLGFIGLPISIVATLFAVKAWSPF
jgi:hypothetical protein